MWLREMSESDQAGPSIWPLGEEDGPLALLRLFSSFSCSLQDVPPFHTTFSNLFDLSCITFQCLPDFDNFTLCWISVGPLGFLETFLNIVLRFWQCFAVLNCILLLIWYVICKHILDDFPPWKVVCNLLDNQLHLIPLCCFVCVCVIWELKNQNILSLP